ncbi:MAG: tetratricopeptide repeat protein [Cyanobacteria bacterium HKST-UBA05]|nr:tetratricopeptide repeat protein [Cyanobacteria bacterium HKST-UBA05]
MKPKQRFSSTHPSRQLTRFALGPASLGLLLSAGLLLSSAVPNGLSAPLVGTAHAQNSQTANSYIAYYNQAMEAYRANNPERAIELLTKANRLNPDDSAVTNNLAASYIQVGVRYHNQQKNYAKAAENYKKALFYLSYMWPDRPTQESNYVQNIKVAEENLKYALQSMQVNPDDAQYHLQQAWKERRAGDMLSAMVSFGMAAIKNPSLTDAWIAQGDIFTIFQRPNRAIGMYEKAAKSTNSPPDTLFVKLGTAHLKNADPAKAADAFNQAVAINPQNKDALLALEQLWKKEIVLNPRNLSAHLNLGTVYQRLGREQDAQAQYAISKQLDPNNPIIDLNMGSLAQSQGNDKDALKFYDAVLAKDPNNTQALINKADLLKSMNRPRDAEVLLNRAMSNARDKRAVMEQLIATYTMQGDAAKIKSGWESYARTYPNDADVLYRAGVAMHEIKDYNMASYYYQQSIGKKPTAEAYANLGSVLHAQNNDSEAIRILETAVKLNPGLQEAQQLLAALRTTNDAQVLVSAAQAHDKNDYSAAIRGYEQYLAKNPNNGDVLSRYGLALQSLHRNTEALTAFDKALKAEPNNAQYYYYKGLLLQELRRDKEAIALYKKALQINPNFTEVKDLLTSVESDALQNKLVAAFEAYERKSYPRAMQLIDEVLQADKQNALAYYYRGLVYEGQKKLSPAKAAYESSVKFDPNNADAVYALAITCDELNQTTCAVTNYQQFLKLNPGGTGDEYGSYANTRLTELTGKGPAPGQGKPPSPEEAAPPTAP